MTATAPVDYRDRYEALTGRSLRDCPCCATGHMRTIGSLVRADGTLSIPDSS